MAIEQVSGESDTYLNRPTLTDCVAIFEHDGQSLSDAQLHRLGVTRRKFGPGPDDQFIEIGAATQTALIKKNRPDGRLWAKLLRRGSSGN